MGDLPDAALPAAMESHLATDLLFSLVALVMVIQKFSLATLNKVKQYIQTTLALPDTERQSQTWTDDDLEEPPEPESLDDLSGVFTFGGLSAEDLSTPLLGNWSISTVNPAASLLKLPGLRLQEGFRLVSYVYRSQGEGAGLIFAVPEALSTTAHLEKALLRSTDAAHPPQPEGALPHFMEAITGDRSPVSFVVGTLLRREFQEFGALGARRSWSHHRLIESLPQQLTWQWKIDTPPKDFTAKVKMLPDGQAAVELFSCRVGSSVTLYRHLEQYPVAHYRPMILDKPIAIAQRR